MSRRRGFTLVELLIAVALATLIVGILAAVSVQTQRTITITTARDDAARDATAALDDLERDLQALLPAVQAPAPFEPERTLQLEAVAGRPATPRDRLRALTTIRAPDGGDGYVRALVEWSLSERTPDPAGGPDAGVLERRIIAWARPGETATVEGPPATIMSPRVIGFTVEWQQPDGTYAPPDDGSRTGSRFVRTGVVRVTSSEAGTAVTATGDDAAQLDAIPIGAEVALTLPTGVVRLLLRRRPGPGTALLNDRVEDPGVDVPFGVFLGPPAIRVTLLVPFGAGPDAQVATVSRTISVAR